MKIQWPWFNLKNYPLPIWDAVLVGLGFYTALLLRFDGAPPAEYSDALRRSLPLLLAFFLGVNQALGLYRPLWKYASAQEVMRIGEAVAISTFLTLLWDLWGTAARPIPTSVILMGGMLVLAGFTVVRYRKRLWTGALWRWWALTERAKHRVLIIGAGEAGQLLATQLRKQPKTYQVVGFVDDDRAKHGLEIHGFPVLGSREEIPALVAGQKVDLLIIAIHRISGAELQKILAHCHTTPAQVKILPSLDEMIEGWNGSPQIRDIKIEDLLGRKEHRVDHDAIQKVIAGKVVLVTGAAGSIGSDLCRQILSLSPRLLLMLDQDETGLHNLTLDLASEVPLPPSHLLFLLGDITNRRKMKNLFRRWRPQVLFHVAAYKHLPMLEENPDEAVRVNVLGTRTMAEMAARYGVERFVFISTDKAVDPTSVLGSSKRLGELLVSSLLPQEVALACSVRFGNVLGSRGSVVPTFERQIAQGGPVTVTHPQMTRYFMSIPEAAGLILEACALMSGGEIFILEMGEEIPIRELAERMIHLHGLRPGVDIDIVYTGPRPGEKLYEELVGEDEIVRPTSNPHVLRIVKNGAHDWNSILQAVDGLIRIAEEGGREAVSRRLQEITAPDFLAPAIPMKPLVGANGYAVNEKFARRR